MCPRFLCALVLAAGCLLAPPVSAQQQDGALPEGPGVDLVYAKCQQCHPISYVTESAGLPDFLWRDTLSLMKRLGMQVTEEEEQTLYNYLTTYLGTEPPPEPAAGARESGSVDGASVYAQTCAACHGADGKGTSAAFPPLAGHAAALAVADRSYPPLVVLYGLAGDIDVAGREYSAIMPGWGRLSNEKVAAVLNFVLEWGPNDVLAAEGFEPYTVDDIEQARGMDLSGSQVHARRPDVHY